MSTKSHNARLKNLWQKNPHCFWCGCEVIIFENDGSRSKGPSAATLSRLISKNDPQYSFGIKNYLILSCRKCSDTLSSEEERNLPKEILWKRSKRYPIQIAW